MDFSVVTSGEDVALAGGDDGADEVLLIGEERELLERAASENFRAFVAGSWPTIGAMTEEGPSPWRWWRVPGAASTPSSNA